MADPTNFRKERIEKLLYELRYEIERGILEHDIDDCLGFQFIVPMCNSKPDGVVFGEFTTRVFPNYYAAITDRDGKANWGVAKSCGLTN